MNSNVSSLHNYIFVKPKPSKKKNEPSISLNSFINSKKFQLSNTHKQSIYDLEFCMFINIDNIFNNSSNNYNTINGLPYIPQSIIECLQNSSDNYDKFMYYLNIIDKIEFSYFVLKDEKNYFNNSIVHNPNHTITLNTSIINLCNLTVITNYIRTLFGFAYTDLFSRYSKTNFTKYIEYTGYKNSTYIPMLDNCPLLQHHIYKHYGIYNIQTIINLYEMFIFLYYHSKYDCLLYF